MSLSTSLGQTASTMIEKYGNTVTLTTTTSDEIYNPQTGTFGSIVSVEHTKKAYEAKISTALLEKSGLPESMWGNIKGLYVLADDADVAQVDTNWKINGIKVTEVKTITAQDNAIIHNIYVG